MIDNKKIGSYIASKRKILGFTQKELAEKLFVTNKAVSKWETGEGLPEIVSLQDLSKILNVPIENILEASDVGINPNNLKSDLVTYKNKLKRLKDNDTEKEDSSEKNLQIIPEPTTNNNTNEDTEYDKLLDSLFKPENNTPPKQNKKIIWLSYILSFLSIIALSTSVGWNVLTINSVTLSMQQTFSLYGFYEFKLTLFLFECFLVLFVLSFLIYSTLPKITKLTRFGTILFVTNIISIIGTLASFIFNIFEFQKHFTISTSYYIITPILFVILVITTFIYHLKIKKGEN